MIIYFQRITLVAFFIFLSTLNVSFSQSGIGEDPVPKIEKLLAENAGFQFDQEMQWQGEILVLLREVYGHPQKEREVEEIMINFLVSDATYAAKKMIWKDFAGLATEASVPQLAKMLRDDEVSPLAMHIIFKADLIGYRRMRKNLSKASPETTISVIHYFGDTEDTEAVLFLSKYAKDSERQVALAALVALGKIGTLSSLEGLREGMASLDRPYPTTIDEALLRNLEGLLKDGQTEAAREAYHELYQNPSNPPPLRVAAIKRLFQLTPDPVEFIQKSLVSAEPVLKADIIRLVKYLPDSYRNGVEFFQIQDLDNEDKGQLLRMLASRKDPSIHDLAVDYLDNPTPELRIAALTALKEVGKPQDAKRLLQYTLNSPQQEKDMALSILYTLPGTEIEDQLISSMSSANPEMLVEIIKIIGRRNMVVVKEDLIRLTRHEQLNVRMEAIETLGKIGGHDLVGNMLELLEGSTLARERRVLERTIFQLTSKNPNGSERSALIRERLEVLTEEEDITPLISILGKISNPEDYPVLKKYLSDKNENIRVAAIKALADWPHIGPFDDLLMLITSEEGKIHQMALVSAIELINKTMIPAEEKVQLLNQLRPLASNANELSMIISGYGNVPDIESLKVLVELMESGEGRPETEAAIRSIMRNVFRGDPTAAKPIILQARGLSEEKEFKEWVDDGLETKYFKR